MNYLVLHRLDGCHIRGREWKIIGHMAAESTLKTAARVMSSFHKFEVEFRALSSEVSPCMRAKDPLSGLQQQTGKNPQCNITIKNAAE
jgi:hypothetical protein